MALSPHLLRQFHVGGQRFEQSGDVVVRYRHALWRAGGARCVDDVGDVVGSRLRDCRTGLAVNSGITDVDEQQIMAVEAIAQIGSGDHGDRRGVVEHELHPRLRHRRVNRDIGRAGFQHRQDRDYRVSRPRQQQRHTLPGRRPVSRQQMRQPVRLLVNLAIRQRLPTAADGQRFRNSSNLLAKQSRNRERRAERLRKYRPITPRRETISFRGIEYVDRREPPRRVGGHRRQHFHQARRKLG